MGSFNTSCVLSHQPIVTGMRCRVVAVAQARSFNAVTMELHQKRHFVFGAYSTICYPDAFWSPVSGILEAEYTDRLSVKLVLGYRDRQVLGYWLKSLLGRAPVVSEGENECHDVSFDLLSFMRKNQPALLETIKARTGATLNLSEEFIPALQETWDYIANVVYEHRLFMADYAGEPRPVAFSFMHEAAYQELVRHTLATGDFRYPAKLTLETLVSGWLTKKGDGSSLSAIEAVIAQEALYASFEMLSNAGRHYMVATGESGVVSALPRDCTTDELLQKLRPLLTDLFLLRGMEALDLVFVPANYAAEGYDNQVGQTYAAFVATVASAVTKSAKEARFGVFRRFTMLMERADELDALLDKLQDWEAAGYYVTGEPTQHAVEVVFECTLLRDELCRFLDKHGTPLMRSTLKLL